MTGPPKLPSGQLLPRRAARLVQEALNDTRVVLVNGARQSGKSTLVAEVAHQVGAEWFSLDRAVTLQAAKQDPTSFVRQAPRMVIDEVQRVPDLFLAMKELVDADPSPGRFLLTGSARVLGLRGLPDSLPGRMETIELWPLSQGEIDDQPDGLVQALFEQGPALRHQSSQTRESYVHRVARGGFPEAVRREGGRRLRFHTNYVADLINRDVMQLSSVERGRQMRAMVDLLAQRSGQLLSANKLAGDLSLASGTVQSYLSLLEEVYLIRRIPAWSRRLATRQTAMPKVAFVDSGIAASLLGQDEATLRRLDSPFGPLLEGFVAMEMARQCSLQDFPPSMAHYRTRDKVEVDLVLERRRQVVAVEVKASATVRGEDFRGLRHLADRLGDDFVVGVVLYLGTQTLSFGDRLRAMPLSALWEVSPD